MCLPSCFGHLNIKRPSTDRIERWQDTKPHRDYRTIGCPSRLAAILVLFSRGGPMFRSPFGDWVFDLTYFMISFVPSREILGPYHGISHARIYRNLLCTYMLPFYTVTAAVNVNGTNNGLKPCWLTVLTVLFYQRLSCYMDSKTILNLALSHWRQKPGFRRH